MSHASQVADRALELAAHFLEEANDEPFEMAAGDPKVLFEASQILSRRTSKGRAADHSAEHLAFSLITAANRKTNQSAPKGSPSTRGRRPVG